jgi:streptogramin lyase
LGMFDPKTGQAKSWPAPDGKGSGPCGIAITPDGKIWYDESGSSRVVSFDPKTGQSTTVDIPTKGAVVRNMEADSTHGRLWLALSGTGRIGRIDLR